MLEKIDKTIEITHDQIKSWRPLIAIPCYDQLVTEPFFMSMMKLSVSFNRLGLEFGISTVSDSLISRARNQLIAKFMADPIFTHVIFIDADIGFDPNDILKMLWHDKDVMTGAYPIKDVPWDKVSELVNSGVSHKDVLSKSLRYVVNPVRGNRGEIEVDNGALNIYDAGTGFMLIKRNVFERMFEEYPHLKYKDDTGSLAGEELNNTYALFNSYIDNDGRFLSEDYGFCRYWQDMGGKIWVDPNIELTHIGRMRYTGRLIDYIEQAFQSKND